MTMDAIAEARKVLEIPDAELRRRALRGDALALDILLARTRIEQTRTTMAAAQETVRAVFGAKAGG